MFNRMAHRNMPPKDLVRVQGASGVHVEPEWVFTMGRNIQQARSIQKLPPGVKISRTLTDT